ncbi:MAG: bifunctional UDP-N-acetylmuramoyl-tripeptide:D-alanyl-D-alanine ligase/alanine racemase [Breznakibacter sp.]
MQLRQIAQIVNGRPIGNADAIYKKIVTDSRKVISASESIFIALKGENHDGHKYISELWERGLSGFIVSGSFDIDALPHGANAVCVDNTLDALQALAAHHRQSLGYPIAAITGSNGKTIVKEWIAQLAGDNLTISRSPKSFNSQVGVPLSLLLLDEKAQLGIVEAGISKPGEMSRLQQIIAPQIGLITNIGQAHQENFTSVAHKLSEKIILFKDCHTIVYCTDHKSIDSEIRQRFPDKRLETWGSGPQNRVTVQHFQITGTSTLVTTSIEGQTHRFTIPYSDHASFENAMHALTLLVTMGVPAHQVTARFPLLKPVAMRLEQKEGINGSLVINDTYNSDITSLEVALDFMNQQSRQQGIARTVILSDILQSGLPPKRLYQQVNQLLEQNSVSQLIGVGSEISAQKECFSIPSRFFDRTQRLLESGLLSTLNRQVVLVKGSRDFGFEHIVECIEQKRHQTVLEINLDALAHNVNKFRSQLKPETKLLAMVKAFSYGSGSFEIASLLQHQKVDYLGVAFADEGVELRKAGIALPIIVMNPEKRSFPVMLQYGLEPEIYSLAILEGFSETVVAEGVSEALVHIKIDTGMMRLGFRPSETEMLCQHFAKHKCLKVQSVFSHLAGSEDPKHDAFTGQQILAFTQACQQIETTVGYRFIRHILNSAGIERFPQSQFEMVRLGIGLYGISSHPGNQLRNVATLKSYISQIKEVHPEESIGYGRRGSIRTGGRIAVVPIGYADGLDRRLSNRVGKMWVNGQFAFIVGNICMDMCMLDISHIDASEGDEVIVFGDNYPVWELSNAIGTIPYEVLTGIGRRVPRVYYQE